MEPFNAFVKSGFEIGDGLFSSDAHPSLEDQQRLSDEMRVVGTQVGEGL